MLASRSSRRRTTNNNHHSAGGSGGGEGSMCRANDGNGLTDRSVGGPEAEKLRVAIGAEKKRQASPSIR